MERQERKIGNAWEKIRGYKETTVLFIVVALIILISIFKPIFLSGENIKTTAIGMSCDGIIAIGMTIALISGGFDLSVGAVMGLSAVITAMLAGLGVNLWIAAVIAMGIGTCVGLGSGLLIGKVGLNPFITTLGMMSIARFGAATANLGSGTEMSVISAGVIGGASLSGGEGSVIGTILGVLLLSIINNALVLFNVSVNWQNLISGAILISSYT
jgi:ribose transport system permease protein